MYNEQNFIKISERPNRTQNSNANNYTQNAYNNFSNSQSRNSLTNAAYELLDEESWSRVLGPDNSYNYRRLYYEIIKKLGNWSTTNSFNFADYLIEQVSKKRKIEQAAYQRLEEISQELEDLDNRINNLIKCQIPKEDLSRMRGIDILHIYKKAHKQSKVINKHLGETKLLKNYNQILPEVKAPDNFCEANHMPGEIEAAKKYYYHSSFYKKFKEEIKIAKNTNGWIACSNVKNFFSIRAVVIGIITLVGAPFSGLNLTALIPIELITGILLLMSLTYSISSLYYNNKVKPFFPEDDEYLHWKLHEIAGQLLTHDEFINKRGLKFVGEEQSAADDGSYVLDKNTYKQIIEIAKLDAIKTKKLCYDKIDKNCSKEELLDYLKYSLPKSNYNSIIYKCSIKIIEVLNNSIPAANLLCFPLQKCYEACAKKLCNKFGYARILPAEEEEENIITSFYQWDSYKLWFKEVKLIGKRLITNDKSTKNKNFIIYKHSHANYLEKYGDSNNQTSIIYGFYHKEPHWVPFFMSKQDQSFKYLNLYNSCFNKNEPFELLLNKLGEYSNQLSKYYFPDNHNHKKISDCGIRGLIILDNLARHGDLHNYGNVFNNTSNTELEKYVKYFALCYATEKWKKVKKDDNFMEFEDRIEAFESKLNFENLPEERQEDLLGYNLELLEGEFDNLG